MKKYLELDDEEFEYVVSNITNNVKKYRKMNGYTQEQLALAIGHSSASLLSKIEAGLENKNFNIRQLYLISKVLNISLPRFFE